MNDVDDLDDLEREVGPTLRVALRRLAGEITDDTPATSPWASDDDLVSQPVEDGVIMVELGHSTRAPTARQRRRPRLNAATIVAAAAVIVVAVVVALSPLDHDTAADQRAAAVAESFMEAWVRGDSQAVAALLSPDASRRRIATRCRTAKLPAKSRT